MQGSLTISILAGILIIRLIQEYLYNRSLPPGPPRLPLIGNLHQAPSESPWITFRKWAQKYGPIISMQFGKDTIVMITDPGIARELLDKRGGIYASRPRMVMAGECLTKGMHMLLRPYNEQYKLHQRLDAPILAQRASRTYCPLQNLESKHLMHEFLSSNNFKKVFDRYAGSLVYSLAYGFRLDTADEQILKTAHIVQENMAYAGRVGTWIVDAIPALNVLPISLAPWKRTAEGFFKTEAAMHMQNMCVGRSSPHWNWTKELSLAPESKSMTELELAYNIGIVSDAGLDTTAVQMRMFILACLSYPSFIPKAQAELDAVVGPNRLPTFEDRPNLPYIDAIVEESLRWRSIQPGGIPHATLKEDNYNGYRIPKGAIVIPLVWGMCLDDEVFESPADFMPERWLDQSPEDTTETRYSNFFGYGRRICTGRHIARNSLFLLIARLLWGYNIKQAVDANGKKREVDDMALTSGFLSGPVPFEAVFEVRSPRTREVIETVWNEADKDVGVLLDDVKKAQMAVGLKLRA